MGPGTAGPAGGRAAGAGAPFAPAPVALRRGERPRWPCAKSAAGVSRWCRLGNLQGGSGPVVARWWRRSWWPQVLCPQGGLGWSPRPGPLGERSPKRKARQRGGAREARPGAQGRGRDDRGSRCRGSGGRVPGKRARAPAGEGAAQTAPLGAPAMMHRSAALQVARRRPRGGRRPFWREGPGTETFGHDGAGGEAPGAGARAGGPGQTGAASPRVDRSWCWCTFCAGFGPLRRGAWPERPGGGAVVRAPQGRSRSGCPAGSASLGGLEALRRCGRTGAGPAGGARGGRAIRVPGWRARARAVPSAGQPAPWGI